MWFHFPEPLPGLSPLGALSGPGPQVPSPLPLFFGQAKKELRFAGGARLGVFSVPATFSTPTKSKPHPRCLGCKRQLVGNMHIMSDEVY